LTLELSRRLSDQLAFCFSLSGHPLSAGEMR